MSTDDIVADLTAQRQNSPVELGVRSFLFACAVLSVVTTVSIILLLVFEASQFFTVTANLLGVDAETASIVDFLTGTTWQVGNRQFGVLALVSATLLITIGSAAIAIPFGVATAIYLSEYAARLHHPIHQANLPGDRDVQSVRSERGRWHHDHPNGRIDQRRRDVCGPR
jgi:phosphate transport system permease protein